MINFICGCLLIFLLGCQRQETFQLDVPVGGDFSINTTRGEFKSTDHRGKILFLFFGFTQCPQICPKTLSHLSSMSKKLSDNERKKLGVLFVTVDIERDSLDVLKKKLSPYSEHFYGGAASEEELKGLMKKFGASYRVFKGKKAEDTAIDHTSDIFIINSKGVWVNSLKYDSSLEEFLAAFKTADKLSPIYSNLRRNRIIEVLDENKECDLSKTPCKIGDFEISIYPRPITGDKNYSVKVSTSSSEYLPYEVDFEGIEQNMGYIRPRLKITAPHEYKGEFYIPACELQHMKWRSRLILKTPKGFKSLMYYFNSTT